MPTPFDTRTSAGWSLRAEDGDGRRRRGVELDTAGEQGPGRMEGARAARRRASTSKAADGETDQRGTAGMFPDVDVGNPAVTGAVGRLCPAERWSPARRGVGQKDGSGRSGRRGAAHVDRRRPPRTWAAAARPSPGASPSPAASPSRAAWPSRAAPASRAAPPSPGSVAASGSVAVAGSAARVGQRRDRGSRAEPALGRAGHVRGLPRLRRLPPVRAVHRLRRLRGLRAVHRLCRPEARGAAGARHGLTAWNPASEGGAGTTRRGGITPSVPGGSGMGPPMTSAHPWSPSTRPPRSPEGAPMSVTTLPALTPRDRSVLRAVAAGRCRSSRTELPDRRRHAARRPVRRAPAARRRLIMARPAPSRSPLGEALLTAA